MSAQDTAATLPRDPNWIGYTGLRALRQEKKVLEVKQRRGRGFTRDDVASLANIEQTRREILALGRARVWVDEQRDVSALNVVRRQMNELAVDNLGLRCLVTEDLMAIRREWPDWEVGQDIDLSVVPVSQQTPERDGPGDTSDGRGGKFPVVDAGPETPDPPV